MLPNFFIVGVPKAGTTALYDAVVQHPDIYMSPVKEPNFFAYPEKSTSINTIGQYEELFKPSKGEKVIGEASTDYFHNASSPDRIKQLLPAARLIAILRNPADRSYSHYNMLVRAGTIPNRPYVEVLREQIGKTKVDSKSVTFGTGIKQSFYYDGLVRYLEAFGEDQFRVFFYDDYKKEPHVVLEDIFRAVGADPSYRPEVRQRNVSTQPKNNMLHKTLKRSNPIRRAAGLLVPSSTRHAVSRWLTKQNRTDVSPLCPEARELLVSTFIQDIENVERLLKKDLTAWKALSR